MKLVIDSCGLGYAAAFTNRGLSHDGKGTGVIHGFLKRILAMGKEFQPDNIIFCWDSNQSHRRRIFPGYKDRNQELTKEEIKERKDIKRQFKVLRTDILPLVGFTNIIHQIGYEADDHIHSLVSSTQTGPYTMVTEDQDMYQSLEYADMYKPRQDVIYTAELFQEEYGIPPNKWAWVKQLAGCTSDTVPGIPGVGEKKAIQYINGLMSQTGKIYQKIISPESLELTSRNAKLVMLPFAGTKQHKIVGNKWQEIGFEDVCSRFGLRDLERHIDEWKELFDGMD